MYAFRKYTKLCLKKTLILDTLTPETTHKKEQTLSAISHSWVDGSSLRTYRHAPNAGSRKSWAAGDATSRGVRLADIALKGVMGIAGVLTA